MKRAPTAASNEAAALLDGESAPSLTRLAEAVSASGPGTADFEPRFENVIRERAWLIHKSGFALTLEGEHAPAMAELANRFAKTTEEATRLGTSLRATIEAQLVDAGLSSDEAQERTAEVIQRWLAA